MFYLYSVHRELVADECPVDMREWWFLRNSAQDREQLVNWRKLYGGDFEFKLVKTDISIKDFFYPIRELKTKSNTSRVLKSIGYTAN